MKEFFKKILKWFGVYHPLQSAYRGIIFSLTNIKYLIVYRKYKGEGYTCNVCHAKYRQFVPDKPSPENEAAIRENQVIAGYGDNIICPACMSTARERLVIAFLESIITITDKRILHLSPEKKIYDFIKQKAVVVTADLSPGFYQSIDRNIKQQDATAFQLDDESFDIVIANHVLEHIPDDRAAMKEIFRILKPGGQAILQVPFSLGNTSTIETIAIQDPVMQSALYGQKDHVRIYALTDYINRLKETGFEVKVIAYESLANYYPFAIQKHESFLEIVKPC